ncbi:MAG: NAD(P)/FAD-dependent oxidoreductase, partial [Dehalococcoidia bacterium]
RRPAAPGARGLANELRRKLGREHRLVLIDREDRHIFSPSLLWLMIGQRKPERITKELALLKKKGIEVLRGEVRAIDPEAKAVEVEGDRLQGDYLVVSLGAQLAPERIPGLTEAGYNLYSLDGSTRIRDARKEFSRGTLVVLVAGMPFKCPAAPYEAAMLLDHDLRKRKVRGGVDVALYSPEAGPMGVTGPEVSAGVRQLVEERDIAYYPQHQATEVDADRKVISFSNEAEARFDFLVYVPPHIAPTLLKDAQLLGDSGWVTVDRYTMKTGFPGVYAIGDITGIPLSMGLPLPKAGVFAHRQAEAVAQTIAAEIRGKGSPGKFDGHGNCFIEVGKGRAGFGRGNFYTEPKPRIKLYKPGRLLHLFKVGFEKRWLRRWF